MGEAALYGDMEARRMYLQTVSEELQGAIERECIDYKTSMITDEDPLRGSLFY